MTQNSVLRQKAREQLGGNIFAKHWLMVLLAIFIYSAIASLAGSIGLGIGAIIVTGPLTFGLMKILVKRSRGQGEVEIGDLFTGFTYCFGESLLLSLLTAIFTALWSLLFVIPGIIKSYAYSMAPYILQDDPAKSWKTCLDESQAMMKGYKWKLFCLDLSFIGWYFVGALCLGIGALFVYPYHYMARTNFYLDIKGGESEFADTFNPADFA
jgi:uncharacterized membrane protein